MIRLLRRWAVAGLLVWLPLAVTLLVLRAIINFLESSLLLLPPSWRPDYPLFGVVLSLVLVLGTGAFAANFLGRQALAWVESALGHIPFVRTIYGSFKKLAETLFSGNAVAFRRAALIRYPHKDSWSIAFQTADTPRKMQDQVGKELVTVFVPTTPNPTSGFLLLVPREDVIWLDMPVEEALRLVISLGVVAPDVEKLAGQAELSRAANAGRG
jgi:uncharacterized membrane protein